MNYVRQKEMHMAEQLILWPCPSEIEIVTEKLKRYKLSGTDQIPAEVIQEEGKTLCSEMHKHTNSV